MSPFAIATSLLNSYGIPFRLIAHPAEGRTEQASALRYNSLPDAAKSLLLRASYGQPKRKRYFLVVVPGNTRLDFDKLTSITGSRKVAFANDAELLHLTGCVSGAVPPLPISSKVALIVDCAFRERTKMVFNVGRLDLSAEISSNDYIHKISSKLVYMSTRSAR